MLMPVPSDAERRRQSRLPHRARIVLSGVDAEGFNFAEETETITVSKSGLSVRTSYHLTVGQELSVRTRDKGQVAQFQVVWAGQPGTPSDGRVGLEWVEPFRFWGIQFPADDWEKE
jgi:hypothetical protein